MRQQVLTVHGIQTTGIWQEQLADAYAPHFECISSSTPTIKRIVRYCDFREIPDGDAFLAYLREVSRNTARDLLRQLLRAAPIVPLEQVDTQASGAELDPRYSPEQGLRSDDLRRELPFLTPKNSGC